jgi:hypothetical protein
VCARRGRARARERVRNNAPARPKMPLARTSCWDEAGHALPGWCGRGACVNGSAGGEGVSQCVCDPGWALRRSFAPEDSATDCTISLLSLRVEWAVLLSLTVVVAVLTARSVRLGKLDQVRGLACFLGLGLIFALAAAALARGGPETSVSGWAMRIIVSDAASYCFCSFSAMIGLDKYVKAVKRSAANVERKGDDSGRRRVLERETIKALVLLALIWVVQATALLAVWSSAASQCRSNLVYCVVISLALARYAHAILRGINADLAFVAQHVSSGEAIGKIDHLRRKVSITHSAIVKPCLVVGLIVGGLLVLECTSVGYPVCQQWHEINIGFWFVVYISNLFGQFRSAALKRDKKPRLITPDISPTQSMFRASRSQSKPGVSLSQSKLSKVKHADSENVPSTPLEASSTSTSVLVNVGHA